MAGRVTVFAMEVRPALSRLEHVLADWELVWDSQDAQAHADQQTYPLLHVHSVASNDPPRDNGEYDIGKTRPRYKRSQHNSLLDHRAPSTDETYPQKSCYTQQ